MEPVDSPQSSEPSAEPGRKGSANADQEGGFFRWAAFLAFLVLFNGFCFFVGASDLYRLDRDPTAAHQQPWLDATAQTLLLESEARRSTAPFGLAWEGEGLPRYTDGVIDPLFPWLMSLYREDDPAVLFRRGKWFNVIISTVFLVLLGLVAARSFSLLGAALIVSLGGLGGMLDVAPLFRPDALEWIFTTISWGLVFALLRSNALWRYGILGATTGLLYLTDSSIWEATLAFAAVSAARTVTELVQGGEDGEREGAWSVSSQVAGLALLLTTFLIVTGPRLSYSNARYGNALHSYSYFTMWLDSPEEAREFRETYPTENALKRMPPGDRPGLVRSWETRGWRDLASRAAAGIRIRLASFLSGPVRPVIVFLCIVFFVLALLHRRAACSRDEHVWRVGGTSARWMAAFAFVAFGITLLSTGVAYPAHPDDERLTHLFLPLVLMIVWIANRFRRQLQRTRHATVATRTYRLLVAAPLPYLAWVMVGEVLERM